MISSFFSNPFEIIAKALAAFCFALIFAHCSGISFSKIDKERSAYKENYNWNAIKQVPSDYWLFDSQPDSTNTQEINPLKEEEIGKARIYRNVFTRYILNDDITVGRPSAWADVTSICKGKIDNNFTLDEIQWQDSGQREKYYKDVNDLIEKISEKLLFDLKPTFADDERNAFAEALKALAWQESGWHHFLKYKTHVFVMLSNSTQNALSDWGITQIARSGFKSKHLLNKEFFEKNGFCSIKSSLYYGFLEYYFAYMHSREMSCNLTTDQKIIGAYNRYVSGFSSCHERYSKSSEEYGNFQKRALMEFKNVYENKPWLQQLNFYK